MGGGESQVNEIQGQIDGAVQEQIQQAISEAVPKAEKKEPTEKSVKFVIADEVLGDLRKICKKLGKEEKEEKEEKEKNKGKKEKEEKKEEYQINNSDEISGFNLRMK